MKNAPRHADQGNGGGFLIGCVAVAFLAFTASLGTAVYMLALRSEPPPVARAPVAPYPPPVSAAEQSPPEPPVADTTVADTTVADSTVADSTVAEPVAETTTGLGGAGAIEPPSVEPSTTIPAIRLGSAEVHGSLDREVIQRVVRRHANEVRYCFEQGLAVDPTLSGRVTVAFVIGPTGQVPTASAAESTFTESEQSRSVVACILSAVRRWTFPAPEGGGIVRINYPFVFAPG